MAAPQSQRFQQLIRRLFSIKEGYDPDVISDFMPTLELSHLYEVDRLHLSDVHLWSVGNTRAAAALTRGLITLTARPNTIVLVKRCWLGGGPAANKVWRIVWNQTAGTPSPQIFPQILDARGIPIIVGVAPQPANVIVQESDTAAGLPSPMIFQALTPAGGTSQWDLDLVMYGGSADPKTNTAPSWQLQFWSENVNESSTYSIFGLYRSIEPSEQY